MAGATPSTTAGGSADEPDNRRADNANDYNSFPVYHTTNALSRHGAHTTAPTAKATARIIAPDLLRGVLMMLMAMDHTSVMLKSWQHGTGKETEGDGIVITHWNFTTPYIVRTFTHLCGAGFTFLLGMGVVYLGRSRAQLGWSSMRLTKYFATRMAVLTAVMVAQGIVLTFGRIWFMNAVLFALAVDYFLAGLLWLAIGKTEPLLTAILEKYFGPKGDSEDESNEEDDETPLLPHRHQPVSKAETWSWHIHNILLFVLNVITIFWNIWFSPNGGHCAASDATIDITAIPKNPLLAVWLWPVMRPEIGVFSGFPPLAWLSFAILGILYGRLLTSRPWTSSTTWAHVMASLGFFLFFVFTRIFRFGNLSEGCLRTPDHISHPEKNPYLVSPASFLYIVKYPPDVAFWAFTMGANMFLLALFGGMPTHYAKRLTMLLDFGTTALFFYIVHMFFLIGMSVVLVPLFGHDTGVDDPISRKPSKGIDNLFAYFGVWAFTLLVLWPVCRWYSRFKSTKGVDSLWRFF